MPNLIRSRDAGIALSLANLCYLRLWAELFCAESPRKAYYLKVANDDFLAAVINVVLLAAIFLAATAAARRWGGRHGRALVIAGFVSVIASHVVGIGPELEPGVFAMLAWWRSGQYLKAIAPVIALLATAGLVWRWPQRSVALSTGAVLVALPFVAVTFSRAAWIVATVNPGRLLSATAPPIDAAVEDVDGPRVVVIVFDAMGRRHAIEARPEGVALPELDRLRSESIDASRVTQASHKTEISLPTFVSGLDLHEAEPANQNDLTLHVADEKMLWSTKPGVFETARDLGGVAIVVGWYHPYCRMFPDLSACAWNAAKTIGSHGQDTHLLQTIRDQHSSLLPYVPLRVRQVDIFRRQRADARLAVTRGGKGLVFLHLIVPHKPWIWNRRTQEPTIFHFGVTEDGYAANLAAADHLLGELRREMEAAGKWTDTAVLLLSDHVLRPPRPGEPIDKRVPFLLKLPGQVAGVPYDRPFNASVTHDLVEALLRGELASPGDATSWLDARALALE